MPVNTIHKRGFTLVELLIVLAIGGLLATVVLAAANTAKGKGRDTRRVSDVKEIQIGLALYFNVYKSYPASLSTLSSAGQNFLSAVPVDPASGSQYSYSTYNNSKNYCLGASLEGSSRPADDVTLTNVNCNGLAGTNYRVSR